MNNWDWQDLETAPMLVGVISNTSPTTSLCFDGLCGVDSNITFRFINPYDGDPSGMDLCDVIIFVRHLFMPVYRAAFEQAKLRRKPVYLLVDDNFVALAGEKQPNPADDELFKPYAQPIFRETLQEMDGILSASPALTEFFRSYHQTILPFSAISDRTIRQMRSGPTDDLRIGFFGGGFRTEALRRQVLPALESLAERRPVTLFASQGVEKFREEIEDADIRLVTVPVHSDFRAFVAKWQSLRLQVAVHPKGESENVKYKTPNAVLVSHYLGAVPIITDEPAYEGIGEVNGVLKIGCDTANYSTALASIETASQRDKHLARLARFCDVTFDPMTNIRTIRKLARPIWPSALLWNERQRDDTRGERLEPHELQPGGRLDDPEPGHRVA